MKKRSGKSVAGGGLNAHILVASTAVEMAEELFEAYARQNDWYRKMRADGKIIEKQARRVFVERVAPRLLEDARVQLTSVLAHPDTTEHVREQIFEALVLDNDLRANRIVDESRVTPPDGLVH